MEGMGTVDGEVGCFVLCSSPPPMGTNGMVLVAINRRFSAVGCTFSSSPPSINLLLLLVAMGATFNNQNFCPSKFGPFLALLLGFSLILLGGIHAQCPRKLSATSKGEKASYESEERTVQNVMNDDANGNANDGQQPGLRPPKHFIQTTFVHRDITDVDREYAQFLAVKLAELRPRLAQQALVTVDNENMDCGQEEGNSPLDYRCREYPLEKAFHYLVVEDSQTGAAVYSLPVERNWAGQKRADTLGRVEMALLDALSRHSPHLPLTGFASEHSAKYIGFVRQLQTAELEAQTRENHKKMMQKNLAENGGGTSNDGKFSILTRSPFELRLLDERILANRRADFDLDGAAGVLAFQGAELAEMIESPSVRAVFVLFWLKTSALSQHSFQIWAKTAQRWKMEEENEKEEGENREIDIVFGAVECREEVELCRAFGIFPAASDGGHVHQLMAFKDGHKMGQQMALGDEQFLLDWIRLLLLGPAIRLESPEEMARAREGTLPGFQGQRPAVTLGRFRDEQQEEFRRFRRAAALLAGRYHFAFLLDPTEGETAKLSTFRREMEGGGAGDGPSMEEHIYLGNFDTRSLLHHITHKSVPDIIDIGHGFTTDLVIRAGLTFLLLHDSRMENSQGLREMFIQTVREMKAKSHEHIGMLELDRANSLPLDGLLQELRIVGHEDWPAICAFNLREFRCTLGVNAESLSRADLANAIEQQFIVANDATEFKGNAEEEGGGANANGILKLHFKHEVPFDLAKKAHPLRQLQLEHIHSIFGPQQFSLEPESIGELTRRRDNHPHNFASMDSPAISGCPMMAHLNNLRDEL